jgi:hypothetical protein
VFVVSPTSAQAMVELAEEFAEWMPLGLGGSNLLRRDGRARRAAPTVPRSGPRRPSVVMFSGPIDSTTRAADPTRNMVLVH